MGSDAKPSIDIQAELDRLSHRSERQQAISKIGEAGAAEAVGPLLRFCQEAKKEERAAVCHALAQLCFCWAVVGIYSLQQAVDAGPISIAEALEYQCGLVLRGGKYIITQ